MLDWLLQNFLPRNHAKVSIDKTVKHAIDKMQLALEIDQKTLSSVFFETECAQSRRGVNIGFQRLNHYLRFLLRVQPATESYRTVRAALETFKTSAKFTAHLQRSFSLEEALRCWKTDVVQELSFQIQKYCEEEQKRSIFDRELLQRYLPETSLTREKGKNNETQKHYQKKSYKRRGIENSDTDRKTEKKARHSYHVQMKRKKVCIQYQEGKCQRGQACWFKHTI